MSKKKIIIGVIVTAVLSSFLTIAGLCFAFGIHSSEVADIVRFLGVKRFIETRYVSDVDETKLMDGAIFGMVQSLGDPHSIYMNADKFEQLKEHTEGEFGGIGVTMGFKDSKVTIISVLDDTPVSEMQPEEVAMHIRGEVGTDVILTIKRGDETKDYTIERATIKIDTAKGTMLEDGMGYIRIASFSENTGKEFKAAYESLAEQGMKGLIIDLRENPGGLVTSCPIAAECDPVADIQKPFDLRAYHQSLATGDACHQHRRPAPRAGEAPFVFDPVSVHGSVRLGGDGRCQDRCDIYGDCGGRCLYASNTDWWGADGFDEVCVTVRHLSREVRRLIVPAVQDAIARGILSLEDFHYPRFNNTTEIIP